eukprot:10786020-Alexandrium_andersonii.AAC.1
MSGSLRLIGLMLGSHVIWGLLCPLCCKEIHKVAAGRSQHECEIMCGGMRAEASRSYAGHAPR